MTVTPHASREPAGELAQVAAVVVNWNGAQHIGHCLAGLAAQAERVAEVIVVDNASTDASLDVVRERCPAARVIEMGTNRGPCPARNRGLAEAATAWVLLLDNDAVLEPLALERMLAAAAADPRAAVVQPRSVFDAEPERVHYDGGAPHYLGLFSLRNFYRPLAQAEGRGAVAVGGAVSVALLVRRDLLLELGGFDERFFILFEDLDLSLRLSMRGHAIVSVEDALVRHRGGTPGLSFRDAGPYPRSRAFLHSRNRWLLLLKDCRWRTLILTAPAQLAFELVWACFALGSGSFGGWLSGKLALARGLGAVLAARGDAQRGRSVPDRALFVGGPLTIAPQLAASGARAAAFAALDRCLRLWWAIVRPLCG